MRKGTSDFCQRAQQRKRHFAFTGADPLYITTDEVKATFSYFMVGKAINNLLQCAQLGGRSTDLLPDFRSHSYNPKPNQTTRRLIILF